MQLDRMRKHKAGFTLVELMVAMSIFTIVLGASAQALISYYSALDFQNQRNTALRHCTTVLSQIREARTTVSAFPSGIVALYPNNGTVAGVATLKGEIVRVSYTNVNANPLEIVVTSTFRDMRGRQMTQRVSTVLADI